MSISELSPHEEWPGRSPFPSIGVLGPGWGKPFSPGAAGGDESEEAGRAQGQVARSRIWSRLFTPASKQRSQTQVLRTIVEAVRVRTAPGTGGRIGPAWKVPAGG